MQAHNPIAGKTASGTIAIATRKAANKSNSAETLNKVVFSADNMGVPSLSDSP